MSRQQFLPAPEPDKAVAPQSSASQNYGGHLQVSIVGLASKCAMRRARTTCVDVTWRKTRTLQLRNT